MGREGDNGWVCFVMRGFSGAPTFTPADFRAMAAYDPKFLAPICLNPDAAKTVLPYYEFRTKLAIEGKTPEQMAEAVHKAYAKGDIPKRDKVSFAYMWSADRALGPGGHWHPHIMVYAPNATNAMLGSNAPGSHLPGVGDDEGTPFQLSPSRLTTSWQSRRIREPALKNRRPQPVGRLSCISTPEGCFSGAKVRTQSEALLSFFAY